MLIVDLELVNNTRKVIVEIQNPGSSMCEWVVAELPLDNDRTLVLSVDLVDILVFNEYEQAELAFKKYLGGE